MTWRDWLDARTGYRGLARALLDEPISGGARWSYVFGSALAAMFLVQVATGVLMALYYSPSSQEAWGSVYFLHTHVRLGWLVRGIHHWGSSAMVALLVLHIGQVFLYGAYRPPRELAWWTGLVLLAVTLAFSLTGYLLPWDQKGYWATRVVASIAGTLPAIGGWLKVILQGGGDFGNLTLTRFFGFHVFFLPAALLAVLVVHVILFRRAGVTPRWSRRPEDIEATTDAFWPRQLTYDLAFTTLIVVIVVALAVANHGASLEAPADPGSNYLARPEWYFLWLFELLHFLPGKWEGIGVSVFAVLAFLFLAALPLMDRAADPSPRARWRHMVTAGTLAAVVAALTVWPAIRDARDPGAIAQRRQADEQATRAFALAAAGIPPGGAEDLYLNDPHERGWRVFASSCQACHRAHGKGGDSAPDLTGFMTRDWVRGAIADPTSPEYFGRTKLNSMPPTDATAAEIDLLTDYVLSQGDGHPTPPGGADLFEEKGCQACHARSGEEPLSAISLAGYGSRNWLLGAIKTPGQPSYYGADNQMPSFDGKLTDAEIDDLIACLRSPAPPVESRR